LCFAGTQNTIVHILAVMATVDALDHTLYYLDVIREVTLMDDRYVSKLVFDEHYFAYFQYQYFCTLCSGLSFLRTLLHDSQIKESMLISCGVDNKFALVQNVMVEQVSHEYYIIYLKEIFVAYLMY
jgi:hypothetical protein